MQGHRKQSFILDCGTATEYFLPELWYFIFCKLFFAYYNNKIHLLGLFGVPAFVIITSRIVNIRQKALLDYLSQLHDHLQASDQSFKTQTQALPYWSRFLQVNRLLVNLMSDIERCATYWSFPLTVYFIGFITIQCYFAYIVFFVPNSYLLVNLFFIYCIILIETFQFMLVNTLAKLTRCNGQFEKAIAKFYLLFNQKNGFKNFAKIYILKVTMFLTFFNVFIKF